VADQGTRHLVIVLIRFPTPNSLTTPIFDPLDNQWRRMAKTTTKFRHHNGRLPRRCTPRMLPEQSTYVQHPSHEPMNPFYSSMRCSHRFHHPFRLDAKLLGISPEGHQDTFPAHNVSRRLEL